MDKLTVEDFNFNFDSNKTGEKKNPKVLMRVDFNVPLKEDEATHKQIIADDSRIKAALPTIKYLLAKNCSIVLMSHLGRPKGQVNKKLSLKPCQERLEQLLHQKVDFLPNCIGKEVEEKVAAMQPGEIVLLENLRFHEGETHIEKDPDFAKKLSLLGNIYVNDAFGTCHRKHASTYEITKYFKGCALAGFLLEKEIKYFGTYLKSPKHPFYAIIGGAKISSKIGVITKLIEKVDEIFIGGGMTYTFLKAQGKNIGNSIYEEDQLTTAINIIEKCIENNVSLNLPLDIVVADKISNDADVKIVSTNDDIPENFEGVDIGPKTISIWSKKLDKAATIFQNGPLGVFEIPKFSNGTAKIAQTLAKSKAITIIGGGDSVSAINSLGLNKYFTHLSTGGGASLEYIENGTLPGIDALSNKHL